MSLCHEDRAFLCRACDVSIHSANTIVAKHSRFLFTNVALELHAVGSQASKKRKAANADAETMNTSVTASLYNDERRARISEGSSDCATVPTFDIRAQMERRVPDYAQGNGYEDDGADADGACDPFEAEFLYLDGWNLAKKKRTAGDEGDFISGFFDDCFVEDLGVVPVF